MDLRSHYPYSLLRYGLIKSYPSLKKNRKTEVTIIGAGITGALVAWQLQKRGIDCIVVDKRHVATGSTAASTSLIQYEIDVPLHRLIKQVGFKNAIRSYQICKEAITGLREICRETGHPGLFESRCSLQFASYKKDVDPLRQEFELRKKNGFKVDFLSEADVKRDYNFSAPAALLVHEAAQLDAYLLTHHIFNHLPADTLYDHTEIIKVKKSGKDHLLTTDEGCTIQSKYLVIACGYESSKYLGKNTWEDLRCTYAFVSEPLAQQDIWKDRCLIWETADPYLYIRACDENRLLVGGKDTEYFPIEKQLELLPQKAKTLKAAFEKKFPHLPLKIDFSWSGAFATTKDGLPYIGSVPHLPGTFFALGYGGNGIIFSYIAGCQIDASIKGENVPDLHLFSFNR